MSHDVAQTLWGAAERWRPRIGDATIPQVQASLRAAETKRQ